jgi:hypothetical protein
MAKSRARADKMTYWLVHTKIVNNEKQAQVLLLTIAIIFLLITAVIVGYYLFGIGNPVQVKYEIPEKLLIQMRYIS